MRQSQRVLTGASPWVVAAIFSNPFLASSQRLPPENLMQPSEVTLTSPAFSGQVPGEQVPLAWCVIAPESPLAARPFTQTSKKDATAVPACLRYLVDVPFSRGLSRPCDAMTWKGVISNEIMP